MNPTQNDGAYKDPLNFLTNSSDQNQPTEEVKAPTGLPVEIGEKGKSGTYIFSGIITREEYNNDLVRFKALENYDIMRRSDATVRSVLKVCSLPILSATWHIEPASEDKADTDVADFVRQELFESEIVFSDLLSEVMTYLAFGYAVFEKVWCYRAFNGQKLIGLQGLHSRKQRSIYRWQTSGDDPQPGITQYVPGGNYSIPMDKLVVFTYDKEGDNYEGISILRPAYKHWKIKDALELIDAIKHERQGLGVIEVIPPEGANQSDVDDAITTARNARASEEAVIKHGPDWIVKFMDMGAHTTSDIMPSLEYHKREISKSVLAQFLELGGSKGGSGSRAVSADHSELFEMALEHIAKYIASTINRQVIKELVDLNFSKVTEYPTLEHSKIGDENVADISSAVATLMSAQALTPDANLEQALRNMMHLPDLPEDIADDYPNRQTGGAPTAPPDPAKEPGEHPPDETDEQTKTANDKLASAVRAKKALISELLDGERIGN